MIHRAHTADRTALLVKLRARAVGTEEAQVTNAGVVHDASRAIRLALEALLALYQVWIRVEPALGAVEDIVFSVRRPLACAIVTQDVLQLAHVAQASSHLVAPAELIFTRRNWLRNSSAEEISPEWPSLSSSKPSTSS